MFNLNQRASGILLHITSLPGPYGIGDFGPGAFHFVDWLKSADQKLWQILPATPIGPANSPYQGVSAFAGSPLMVALEPLIAKGWLPTPVHEGFDAHKVDYGRVIPWREAQLRIAAKNFFAAAKPADTAEFSAWCKAEAAWLDEYALFMAIRAPLNGAPWWMWETGLRKREPAVLARARVTHGDEMRFWQFVQWCFAWQCAALKTYANAHDVAIIGDLPIFVAHDSADCWARPDLYYLDADDQPSVVAGVPPDGFSEDGQRWGNPLYRWDKMAAEGYAWWIARVTRALEQADIFRIDHFRGFAGYYEIPASCPTAREGAWIPGPAKSLFDAIELALGKLPIIAEDLGLITPDVLELRDGCGYPGMRILQFAFGGDPTYEFLPHNYVKNTVAYTGTHDNETARGWFANAPEKERALASAYLDTTADNFHWAMIRAASNSVANLVVYPLQDVLGLDGSHRMNLPGTTEGNWAWRFTWEMVGSEPAKALAAVTRMSARGVVEK